MSVPADPIATSLSVCTEQGATIIPITRKEPLAIGAAMSPGA